MADQDDKGARFALITRLALSYPGTRLEPEHVKTYVLGTRGMPMNLLEAAIGLASQKSPQFFPPLPLIIRAARKLAARGLMSAEAAWEWVSDHLGDSGRSRPRTGFELIERAVTTMGGWDQLGQKPTAQRHWTRREFMTVYRALLGAEASRIARGVVPLPGESAAQLGAGQ